MSGKLPAVIVGFAVVVVLVAFGLSPAITATQTDANRTVTVDNGDSRDVADRLNLTAVNTSASSAEVRMEDTATGDWGERTINEGENATYDLSGERVVVTVDSSTTSEMTGTVDYPRTYGWSEEGKEIGATLDVVIALVGFLAVMSAVAMAVRV